MGPAQVLRRLTANHDGATGRERHLLAEIFAFCSDFSRRLRKVFSIHWE